MDLLFSLALQILYGIANLALISLGLAIAVSYTHLTLPTTPYV